MANADAGVELLTRNLQRSINAKSLLLKDSLQLHAFSQAVDWTTRALASGHRLYIAGNGGSAADAQHLAAEFVSRLARERKPLPAEALTVDSSVLTAISNDYGYEKVFSRQLEAKAGPGDIFLGITTSGESLNIHSALLTCRELGVTTILFSGHMGGLCREIADIVVLAPGESTSTIQEVHILLAHSLCEAIEQSLFPEE